MPTTLHIHSYPIPAQVIPSPTLSDPALSYKRQQDALDAWSTRTVDGPRVLLLSTGPGGIALPAADRRGRRRFVAGALQLLGEARAPVRARARGRGGALCGRVPLLLFGGLGYCRANPCYGPAGRAAQCACWLARLS